VQVHTRVVDRLRIDVQPWERAYKEDYEHLALELGSQGWIVIGPKQRVEQRGSTPHGLRFPDAYCMAMYILEPVAEESLDMIVTAMVEHLPSPRLPGHPDRKAIIFGQSGDALAGARPRRGRGAPA
jgi:hypothetical protein